MKVIYKGTMCTVYEYSNGEFLIYIGNEWKWVKYQDCLGVN